MDTVLGCEGSRKVVLTFHFDSCSLMMAYLMDSKQACHVKTVFDSIEHTIGTASFSSAFSLILTDRGGEFQNPDALECGQDSGSGLVFIIAIPCVPGRNLIAKRTMNTFAKYVRKELPLTLILRRTLRG